MPWNKSKVFLPESNFTVIFKGVMIDVDCLITDSLPQLAKNRLKEELNTIKI